MENLNVPVGGDQLTRVRLQGAKALRLGAFTSKDRFEHLNPVIVEMYHTLQDFLEVLINNMDGWKGILYKLKLFKVYHEVFSNNFIQFIMLI